MYTILHEPSHNMMTHNTVGYPRNWKKTYLVIREPAWISY